ncbi:hypothetical protein A5788_07525 [Gordonia sp. 852002-50816_SCH5313054-c]|nr:hypothetical protein A5788_07525 [Gordonia sp. 852002-50816_SCH5313054-c]
MEAGLRRPTIKDVASVAGVSVTTVSHALNDKGRVDDGTRQRIKDIAIELGYSANPRARALRTGGGRTIGLITGLEADQSPDRDSRFDWYMRTAFAGAAEALRLGYALVLMPPSDQQAWVRELTVDGVLVIDPEPEGELVPQLLGRNLPVVVIGGQIDLPGVATVALDRRSAVAEVLKHFARRGRRRPAIVIDDSRRQMTVGTAEAYRASCAEPLVEIADTAQGRSAGGAAAMMRLLEADPLLDAIYAPLDSIAVGCVSAIADSGRDVEVVTAEGLVAQAYGLCGVDTRREDQAAEAAKMLIDQIETGVSPRSRVLTAGLVER